MQFYTIVIKCNFIHNPNKIIPFCLAILIIGVPLRFAHLIFRFDNHRLFFGIPIQNIWVNNVKVVLSLDT